MAITQLYKNFLNITHLSNTMSKLSLMTGAVFTDNPLDYIGKLHDLNVKYSTSGKVTEVYGSLRSDVGLPTARPNHRLPDISFEYLTEYVKCCNEHNIIFNYTANSPLVGDLSTLSENYDKYVDFLKSLESIGVGRITIANPMIMKIVSTHTDIPIEVSTIQSVRTAPELIRLKQLYKNINKVCVSIDINRNMSDLKAIKSVGENLGVEVEVIATEFCKTDRSNCVHRMHCYNLHAYNMTKDVARGGLTYAGNQQPTSIKGYPWQGADGCIFSRTADYVPWLISNTVWPNILDQYIKSTNITNFKITTRTAPPDYAIWLVERYLAREFEGNLSQLWLQLSANDKFANKETNFNETQDKNANIVPYQMLDLMTKRHITMSVGHEHMTGDYNFFDVFILFPNIDWSKILWVDKSSDELESYESNWADKWDKILTTKNNE